MIILSGLWLIVAGIIMFAKPLKAKTIIAKAGSTNNINYIELGLRSIWATTILYYALLSKFPAFFNLFGIMLAVTTVILLLVPRNTHARFAKWNSAKLSTAMLRLCAPLATFFGIFIINAVINQ